MRSTLEIGTKNPRNLKNVLEPSLETKNNISYILSTEEDKIKISVEADRIGPLRGCTDTAFRLTTLTKKINER